MSAMLTADWCLLKNTDTYYRKFEVYSMNWHSDINLENCLISVAPFGGPIALVRDRKKIVQVHGGGKPIIAIYSGSGKQLSSVVWNSGVIVTLGWSDTEQLICIQEEGMVFVYDMFGKFQKHFGLGNFKENKVIDAKVYYSLQGTGVAILTANFKITIVNNIKEPKIRPLSQLSVSANLNGIIKWGIICEKRETEVLLACSAVSEVFRFTEGDRTALPRPNPTSEGNIIDMAISINNAVRNTSIALFTDAGYLWIGTFDLKTKYCEILLDKRTSPKQMLWCGGEAVVCYWPGVLHLVSRCATEDDMVNFYYDTPLYLAQELDCVRIISNLQYEILQKVPLIVQRVLRINSTDPGSYLLEASKHFQKRSHRSDEYISLIKDNLEWAVDQCIESAGYEFDTDTQKMLMQAAQYGKSFVPEMNPDKYVQMCRELKVLNTVRDKRIGIPLTYTELHTKNYQNLLDRLVTRGFYYHAIQIAKHLRLPDDIGANRIYVHWACYKVTQSDLEWDEIAQQIANKLGRSPGISYSDIASKAEEFGRTKLAIKLLDYEPRARKQVPLLLKLRENIPALLKAIESGDTDLIYTVIFHMRENTPLADFQMTIRNFPIAQALYLKYCREHNLQSLNDIYLQEDDFTAQAAEYIRESFEPKNALNRESCLSQAEDAYKKARNDINAALCEESIRLLRHQKQFEEKLRHPFVGKSAHDTLHTLLALNEIKLAEKMRSEYKVPDRRFWWLRIQTLGEKKEWSELEKFSKSKKSPVGYAPFVDVCLKYGNKIEAMKYVSKVREDVKIKYYLKLEMYEEAAQTAFEQKDLQGLLYIQAKSNNKPIIVNKINVLITQLTSKK